MDGITVYSVTFTTEGDTTEHITRVLLEAGYSGWSDIPTILSVSHFGNVYRANDIHILSAEKV